MTSGGATAKKRGAVLETIIVSTLVTHGFTELPYRQWLKNPTEHGDELLLRNAPYTNIYGRTGRTEFVVKSARRGLNLRIEAKWQQGSGSVDEKFPYTYLNAIEFPEDEVIILVGGDGFRDGSVDWLKRSAAARLWISEEKPSKRIRVMDPTEFITWANTQFT